MPKKKKKLNLIIFYYLPASVTWYNQNLTDFTSCGLTQDNSEVFLFIHKLIDTNLPNLYSVCVIHTLPKLWPSVIIPNSS